jgi:hypothetical protein
MLICMTMGIIMLLQFFVPHPFIQDTLLEWVNNSAMIVAVFALAIGLASLVHMHGNRIKRRLPGWGFSVITLGTAALVAAIGLLKPAWGPSVAREQYAQCEPGDGATLLTTRIVRVDHTLFGFDPVTVLTAMPAGVAYTQTNISVVQDRIETNISAVAATLPLRITSTPLYDWYYRYVHVPLVSTTFCLLAFYMITAAYRAMRIRSWEAALLMAAALVVIIGQVPADQFLPLGSVNGVPFFEWLKQLIMDYPNSAAKRSIIIGVALGGLATGVKILAGIEKPYLGGRE